MAILLELNYTYCITASTSSCLCGWVLLGNVFGSDAFTSFGLRACLGCEVFVLKLAKQQQSCLGKTALVFPLNKDWLTEEGLAERCRVHPIPGQFPPSLPTNQPVSSLTTICETISLVNIQLPTFIGNIATVSRKYLSFHRMFVEC